MSPVVFDDRPQVGLLEGHPQSVFRWNPVISSGSVVGIATSA